ncbi:MAG: protein jag [Intrasporangium sp.]|uniref:Jag family protein n=1 Tax=Intrasporangium sp. TaxID=1925024 RepID=UPI003F7DD4FD
MSDSAQHAGHDGTGAEHDLSAVADAAPADALAAGAGAQPLDVSDGPVAGVIEPEQAGGPLTESTASDDSGDADSSDAEESGEQRVTSRRGSRVKQLEREGEVAADFLETLLDIADLDGDLDVDVEGDRAIVAIVDSDEGRVPRRLVGTDGKVLDALQELTRLAVQVETGERSRLMLDIAGHRAARRAALVDLAHEAISAVQESGKRRELDPMSAFERKVVHDEVAAAGLVSESEGVEPNRYIVILPH